VAFSTTSPSNLAFHISGKRRHYLHAPHPRYADNLAQPPGANVLHLDRVRVVYEDVLWVPRNVLCIALPTDCTLRGSVYQGHPCLPQLLLMMRTPKAIRERLAATYQAASGLRRASVRACDFCMIYIAHSFQNHGYGNRHWSMKPPCSNPSIKSQFGICTRDDLIVEIPLASIPLSDLRSVLHHFQRHQARGRHKPCDSHVLFLRQRPPN
jgi:hypothetical protein